MPELRLNGVHGDGPRMAAPSHALPRAIRVHALLASLCLRRDASDAPCAPHSTTVAGTRRWARSLELMAFAPPPQVKEVRALGRPGGGDLPRERLDLRSKRPSTGSFLQRGGEEVQE